MRCSPQQKISAPCRDSYARLGTLAQPENRNDKLLKNAGVAVCKPDVSTLYPSVAFAMRANAKSLETALHGPKFVRNLGYSGRHLSARRFFFRQCGAFLSSPCRFDESASLRSQWKRHRKSCQLPWHLSGCFGHATALRSCLQARLDLLVSATQLTGVRNFDISLLAYLLPAAWRGDYNKPRENRWTAAENV